MAPQACLMMMWHEVDDPGGEQGHYDTMSSLDFTGVACGVYETPEGGVRALQNYFR